MIKWNSFAVYNWCFIWTWLVWLADCDRVYLFMCAASVCVYACGGKAYECVVSTIEISSDMTLLSPNAPAGCQLQFRQLFQVPESTLQRWLDFKLYRKLKVLLQAYTPPRSRVVINSVRSSRARQSIWAELSVWEKAIIIWNVKWTREQTHTHTNVPHMHSHSVARLGDSIWLILSQSAKYVVRRDVDVMLPLYAPPYVPTAIRMPHTNENTRYRSRSSS